MVEASVGPLTLCLGMQLANYRFVRVSTAHAVSKPASYVARNLLKIPCTVSFEICKNSSRNIFITFHLLNEISADLRVVCKQRKEDLPTLSPAAARLRIASETAAYSKSLQTPFMLIARSPHLASWGV